MPKQQKSNAKGAKAQKSSKSKVVTPLRRSKADRKVKPRTPALDEKNQILTASVYALQNSNVTMISADGYCHPQQQRFTGRGGVFVNGSSTEQSKMKQALEVAVTKFEETHARKFLPYSLDKDLHLNVTFYYAIPTGREDLIGRGYRGHAVDLSNLLKFVEDAMNGIIFVDDSQLVRIHMSKQYGETNAMTATLLVNADE